MSLYKFPPLVLFVAVLACIALGEIHLSGDISKFNLSSDNSPFIVDQDIEVPENKKVIIPEGCIFLFNDFSGLTVYGSLVVNGSPSKPVVFTTINDSLFNKNSEKQANPFDWNGIRIDKSATNVTMNNFKLMYSVYGIKSQTINIILKNGLINSNGQYHFTVFDKIQYVNDAVLYSYPVDSTSKEAVSFKSSQNRISIKTFPAKAELYINKKPGKRTSPDAFTPTLMKNLKTTELRLTLFKKGYSDTTLIMNINHIPKNSIDVALSPLSPQLKPAQDKFLKDRLSVQIGTYCLISSPLFLIAGGGLLYYAGKNYEKANDAKYYLDHTIVTSGAKYKEMQDSYSRETINGAVKQGLSVVFFGLGTVTLGGGVILYF